jgi:hypothetical protein
MRHQCKEGCHRKQIMQRAGRGRIDRRWRRARRISADWIRDEGSRPDQADSPETDQDPPDFMAGTAQGEPSRRQTPA